MSRVIFALIFIFEMYGLSSGESLVSKQDFTIPQIKSAIHKYGKHKIIEVILARKSQQITVQVGHELRTFYGAPDPIYVTPQTILIDLKTIGMTINNLYAALQEDIKSSPPLFFGDRTPTISSPSPIQSTPSQPPLASTASPPPQLHQPHEGPLPAEPSPVVSSEDSSRAFASKDIHAPSYYRKGNTYVQPYKNSYVIPVPKDVHVHGYYRNNGTYVQPHMRSRPRR